MSLIDVYKQAINSVISFVENRRNFIPFSRVILWYLRIPMLIKIFIGVLLSLISFKIIYTFGFIIAQSKGKNEVLSLISAYQNPIEYPHPLILYYSFIFCILFGFTLLPIVLAYVFKAALLHSMIPKMKERSFGKIQKWFFIISSIVLFIFIQFILVVPILLEFLPVIPYYMIYQSKDSSLLEGLFKYIMNNNNSMLENTEISYKHFKNEIMYSFTMANIILVISSIFLVFMMPFKKKTKLGNLISGFVTIVLSFIIIFVLTSHTFYQWGNLGKNLSQFDRDYISVEYTINKNLEQLEGVKVFQQENYLIVRDSCNRMHYITSDEIHISSLTDRPVCKQ